MEAYPLIAFALTRGGDVVPLCAEQQGAYIRDVREETNLVGIAPTFQEAERLWDDYREGQQRRTSIG